jgi:hypothetical protein
LWGRLIEFWLVLALFSAESSTNVCRKVHACILYVTNVLKNLFPDQSYQMVPIPILVDIWRACNENYWYILRPFGVFCGNFVCFMVIWCILWYLVCLWWFRVFFSHLECFVVIWYILSHFCILYYKKSGNPALYFCLSVSDSVTRLGEISPFGRYFSALGAFF